MFKDFIIISSLIMIHECGHFFCAKLLGFQTDKIYLYPLGGVSKFYMPICTARKKEILILLMGPLFQFIGYFLLLCFMKDKNLITSYHLGILFFNLLPVYPLDGGKLMNILLSSLIPYKKSLILSITISYLITIIILFSQKRISLNVIIMYLLLVGMIRKEELKTNTKYQRFLLERYIKKYNFSNDIYISNESNFYRYKNNKIITRGIIQKEAEYLRKKYKIFGKKC